MANVKISQLTPKGANLEATDLLEISEFDGSGYVTRSITGQEIIDAASGGDFVPYIGATSDLDLGTHDLKVNEIFLYDAVNDNYGSTHYTDGNYHIEDADGHKLLVIEDGFVQIHKTDTIQSNLYTSGLTVTRDHYLPDQSGTIALTSDLATKQDTLVSGTNIKTINGSSVLGSGNLSISGGGLQGVHNVLNYFPSTAYGIDASICASNVTTQATTTNTLYLYPFIPNKTITSVSLKIQVTILGAGVNCRILIYSDLNGFPNTKLYESANLDCSTIGVKTATTAQTFNAGTTYWLALHSSGVTTLSHINSSAATPLYLTNVGSNSITQYTSTITFGSAPSTYTYSSQNTGAIPKIVINLS